MIVPILSRRVFAPWTGHGKHEKTPKTRTTRKPAGCSNRRSAFACWSRNDYLSAVHASLCVRGLTRQTVLPVIRGPRTDSCCLCSPWPRPASSVFVRGLLIPSDVSGSPWPCYMIARRPWPGNHRGPNDCYEGAPMTKRPVRTATVALIMTMAASGLAVAQVKTTAGLVQGKTTADGRYACFSGSRTPRRRSASSGGKSRSRRRRGRACATRRNSGRSACRRHSSATSSSRSRRAKTAST